MVALLYPFEWQHTYVTVLTTSLIDLVEAPTPYIIGILTSMKSFLEDYDLSEVSKSRCTEFYYTSNHYIVMITGKYVYFMKPFMHGLV